VSTTPDQPKAADFPERLVVDALVGRAVLGHRGRRFRRIGGRRLFRARAAAGTRFDVGMRAEP
jgi:hypothetical protein